MKHSIVAILFGLLLLPFSTIAEEVTVSGYGEGRKQAVQDALLTAVGQVNGIVLYGKSTLEKERLIEDKVTQAGYGFVQSYRVLSEKLDPAGYRVELLVDVQKMPEVISSEETTRLERPDLNRIDAHHKVAKGQREFFTHRYGNLEQVLSEAYEFTVQGLSVEQVFAEKITGSILVRLRINQRYWSQYKKVIQKLAVPSNEMNTGLIEGGNCLAVTDGYFLPEGLLERDIPPLKVSAEVGGFSRNLLLIRDAAVLFKETEFPSLKTYPANIGTPQAQISYEIAGNFLCRHKASNRPVQDVIADFGLDGARGRIYTDLIWNDRLVAVSAEETVQPEVVFKIPFSVANSEAIADIEPEVIVHLQ